MASKIEKESLLLESENGNSHSVMNKKKGWDIKLVSFVLVGVMSLIYVVAELAAAVRLDSLVLLSDGFHNLSDVVSLYIAYWARQAAKRASSEEMSYGWARTEILGGLSNGCFLISLVVYVMLQSIPKFIHPIPMESGLLFIIISACGLAVNTIGTIIFAATGTEGHSHSHGGGHSHGHGHEHKEKDKKEKKDKKKKKEKHELSETGEEKKEKKEKHGHKHGHGHGHEHKEKDKKKKKSKRDENVYAVFLHFLGDAISSLMVLTAGILIYFFHSGTWTWYIDPISSLVVCALILYTTIPLIKRCAMILLQSTGTVPIDTIKKKLTKVEGLLSVHDLHVWQLVDGMAVGSVHVAVEEGVDFNLLVDEVKKIFHQHGVHSSSIQPEFVPRNFTTAKFCAQNCVKECDEEWCCKKSAEISKEVASEFSIHTEL